MYYKEDTINIVLKTIHRYLKNKPYIDWKEISKGLPQKENLSPKECKEIYNRIKLHYNKIFNN